VQAAHAAQESSAKVVVLDEAARSMMPLAQREAADRSGRRIARLGSRHGPLALTGNRPHDDARRFD
jgi:hypothetical protein